MLDKLKNEGCYMSYLRNINVRWGCFDFTDVLKMRFKDDEVERYMIEKGDLVLCEGGEPGRCAIWDKANPIMFQKALHRIRCYGGVLNEYLKYVIEDYAKANKLEEYYTGSTIKHLTGESLVSILFPLPPVKEQERIVQEIQRYLSLVAIIENNKENLLAAIKQAKSKVLDLAIHGKLVPQAPNEEPAIELLKRINPKAEIITDNGHYQKLPVGWCLTKVKDAFIINPKNKENDDIEAGFVPMANISDGFSNHFSFETKKWETIKSGFTHFSDGDIAVAKISPCLENRKSMVLSNLPNGIGAGTTELHVFRPLCVTQLYGLYFFKSNYFINKCIGTFNGVVGQQRVGKNIVECIDFPLPPLAEQQRIVAKIEEIFQQLDMIETAL